jgi:parvulin-like peptidyl-prolyl isomerase
MKAFSSLIFGLAATLSLCTFAFGQADTVVSINGEAISQKDYYRRMEYLPGLGRPHRGGEFVEILPGIATLDAIITEKLLLQLAKTKNLLPTETEIDNEVKFRLRRDPNTLVFWKALGRTEAEYRNVVRVDLAQYNLQTEGVKITDKEINDLYQGTKATRYTLPKRYVLRAITVDKEEIQKKVEAELKANKSFAAVAVLYSIDETKEQGGKFGEVPLSLLQESLRNILAKLKKGERSSWVKSDKGSTTLFLVEDILPETTRELDADLKSELRREMSLRKGNQFNNLSKLMREARSKAEIKITSPEFDEAYKRFMGVGTQSGG